MAAKDTLAHRWLPGIATAALLSAVASAAAAPAAAAAGHSPAAISASQPPGYQVVSSGLTNAPPGASSSGAFATCPAGTVVWGGGVAFNGFPGAGLTVNTSSPNGSGGWEGWVNNTGATTAQFVAYAICADKPAGYKIVSREVGSPPGTQSHATATCPTPDVLLGGGALSTADQAAAVLTSAWPMTSAKFTGYLDNGTASAANIIADAVCGHKRLATRSSRTATLCRRAACWRTASGVPPARHHWTVALRSPATSRRSRSSTRPTRAP